MPESVTLLTGEVDGFLAWLFETLATRPRPLHMKRTIEVARYLLALRHEGVPREVISKGPEAIKKYCAEPHPEDADLRGAVDETIRTICDSLLRFGRFKRATRKEAEDFFRKFKNQWHEPWFEPTLKFVQDFDLPADSPDPPSRSPVLEGPEISAQGGEADLRSDLSERIAVADYVLRRMGIPEHRLRIAEALNRSAKTRRPDDARDSWGPEEVRDRVRTYERRKDRTAPERLVNDWIARYMFSRYVRGNQPLDSDGRWKARVRPYRVEQ